MVNGISGRQEFSIKDNTISQGNKSEILMEMNVRNAGTANLRHTNIHYFFIKDSIEKGEVKVKYCPTRIILEDCSTKTIMGEGFRDLSNVIMVHKTIFDLDP